MSERGRYRRRDGSTDLGHVSEYERLFGVRRNRRPGRPRGVRPQHFVFPRAGKDPDVARAARQRAVAVVMEENKERLRSLYESEYALLESRKESAANL